MVEHYAGCWGWSSYTNNSRNGILIRNRDNTTTTSYRTVNIAAVTDGLSNTLMVGDKRLNASRLNVAQSDDNEGYTSGWDHDMVRSGNSLPAPDLRSGTGNGGGRFGSSHTGGFVAVLGDGSVRFIRYSVNLTAFRNLCAKSDGNARSID